MSCSTKLPCPTRNQPPQENSRCNAHVGEKLKLEPHSSPQPTFCGQPPERAVFYLFASTKHAKKLSPSASPVPGPKTDQTSGLHLLRIWQCWRKSSVHFRAFSYLMLVPTCCWECSLCLVSPIWFINQNGSSWVVCHAQLPACCRCASCFALSVRPVEQSCTSPHSFSQCRTFPIGPSEARKLLSTGPGLSTGNYGNATHWV